MNICHGMILQAPMDPKGKGASTAPAGTFPTFRANSWQIGRILTQGKR